MSELEEVPEREPESAEIPVHRKIARVDRQPVLLELEDHPTGTDAQASTAGYEQLP